MIAGWLEHAFPGESVEMQDARQETMISLFRSVGRMRAEAPLQAAKWVGTILRRKRVDALRATNSDPVHRALRSESTMPDATPILDRIASDDGPTATPEMLEALVTRVLEHVHRALDESVPSAARRQLRRAQAQAALLRLVCDWDAEAITVALDYGEPVGKSRLYKWVERGRDPVLAGLDRWAAEDEEELGVIAVLREIMEERRSDAGAARPDRRKGTVK